MTKKMSKTKKIENQKGLSIAKLDDTKLKNLHHIPF